MPITITLPPPGTSIGPGYLIGLTSDFIGPLPTGTTFHVRISSHPEGTPNVIWQIIPTQGTQIQVLVGDRFTVTTSSQQQTVPAGSNVHVVAELVTSSQQVIDSGVTDVPVTYDPTTMLWQHVNQNTGTGGGLTGDQATQLQETHNAVLRAWQVSAGLLQSTPIGGLISHPDPNLLRLHNPPFILRGRGFLTGLPPLGLAEVWGLQFVVTLRPTGAGLIDGNVPYYQYRVVEFCAEYNDAGSGLTYIQEIQRFHEHQLLWLWDRFAPLRILYDVTPEFELTCHWLTVL